MLTSLSSKRGLIRLSIASDHSVVYARNAIMKHFVSMFWTKLYIAPGSSVGCTRDANMKSFICLYFIQALVHIREISPSLELHIRHFDYREIKNI